jgi:hypothetical protein
VRLCFSPRLMQDLNPYTLTRILSTGPPNTLEGCSNSHLERENESNRLAFCQALRKDVTTSDLILAMNPNTLLMD